MNENNDVAVPTPIADPVMATDPDGNTISYTLGGTDAASFDIDEGSGQLMTKARLNHEEESTYTVVVTAQDNSARRTTAPPSS